eukprot:403375080
MNKIPQGSLKINSKKKILIKALARIHTARATLMDNRKQEITKYLNLMQVQIKKKEIQTVSKQLQLKKEVVLSNQLNFVNSINYRNKNDFNSSLGQFVDHQAKVQQSFKECSDSSNSSSGDKDEEKEDIKNILEDLFPNYQQDYWNERSTWNPIINKQNNKTLNDTFDVSFHSADLKQNIIQNTTNNDNAQKISYILQHSPFMLDDVSVIFDPKRRDQLQSSQEQKHHSGLNQDHDHDHHHEMFFEGLTSLFLERRSSINNNMQFQFNNAANTLSHSSDSQCKTLKNSLKYKVMVHSSNDYEALGLGGTSKLNLNQDKSENKSRFEIKIVGDPPNTEDLTEKVNQEQENLLTPNFQTPKLTPVQSKDHNVKSKISEDICFYRIQSQDQNTGMLSDDPQYVSELREKQQRPSFKRFKITNTSSNQPLSTASEKQMQHQFGSSNLNQEAAQATLNKQKSMIINYDSNIRFLNNDHSQPHSSNTGWNNILQNHSSTNEIANMLQLNNFLEEVSPQKNGGIGTIDLAMQSSSKDYFQFDNTSSHDMIGEMSSKSSNFLLSHLQMGMYKQDINALQHAFKKYYKDECKISAGHFCIKTEQLVQKFQKLHNLPQDGIVDHNLWQLIMGETQNIQHQDQSNELRRTESNDNTFGGATYDNQSQTPGLLSPDNLISRDQVYCISDDSQPANLVTNEGNEKQSQLRKINESQIFALKLPQI